MWCCRRTSALIRFDVLTFFFSYVDRGKGEGVTHLASEANLRRAGRSCFLEHWASKDIVGSEPGPVHADSKW